MKWLRFARIVVFLAAVVATAWAGAPLKLTDGRVFENWTIIGQTAAYVTIKYDQGAVKISKTLLPEPLRAKYPIDPAAVAAEEAASVKLRAIYDDQRKVVAAQKAYEDEEFEAEVQKAVAEREAARRQATIQIVAAAQVPLPAASTQVTNTETHLNTPRSIATSVTTTVVPPENQRKTYTVEYEVTGQSSRVDVRFGQNGQHDEIRDVSPYFGWSRKVQAKSGDQLYLWAESGGAGGEEFLVRIKLDGQVVREATGRGVHVAAAVSYALP